MPIQNQEIEALIVGGGVAGSSLAIALARAGRKVVVVEKKASAHDKVCGEFLSAESASLLETLGVSLKELGATPIETVRLAGRDVIAQCRLPDVCMSVSRRLLDAALLDSATAAGAAIRLGTEVRGLTRDASLWSATLSSTTNQDQAISARSCFLATGKHDVFGWGRQRSDRSELVGFKMYFRLSEAETARQQGVIDLVLFPQGYCGITLVGPDTANLSLLITRHRLRSLGGAWPNILTHITKHSPYLGGRFVGAKELWARPMSIGSIPFGHCVDQGSKDIWRVGDQAAVISSFTGSGIAIALHTAACAGQMYLDESTPSDYHRHVRGRLRSSMRSARGVAWLMLNARPAANACQFLPAMLAGIYRATRIPSLL